MFTADAVKELRCYAAAMAPAAPASAMLLSDLSDEIENASPVATFLAAHPDSAAPLFLIRVVACAHWLMLRGRAPDLAAHVGQSLSGMNDPNYLHRTWELSRQAILNCRAEAWEALRRPVQQHHPGRAGVLLRGLAMLATPSVRVELLELGACAGLNLLLDRYCWFGPNWQWGDPLSPVRLATAGPRPGNIEIVRRAGCDLSPRQADNAEDATILRSYLPPEAQIARREMDEALAVASQNQLLVDRANAVDWLRTELDRATDDNVCTVVWHSLFWSYLDAGSKKAIEETLDNASNCGRWLARISFEPLKPYLLPRLHVTLYR